MKKFLSLFIFLNLYAVLYAQPDYDFERYDDIPVYNDGQLLANAWAGGLNSPQLSRIDVNLDGAMDLFFFDRSSNRILVFVNQDPSPGSINYKHTTEYNQLFPEMSGWCLLRDFNCDGKMDIFTKAPNSMKVYENTSTEEDGLEFTLRTDLLNAIYDYSGVPFTAPVYSVTVDIPAIDDIDGDGDLDILTFSEIAATLYFYKNYAVELGNCDSLAFELVNRCYGFVSEASEDNSLFLGPDHVCDFNVVEPRSGNLHTGGTLLTLDTNQDGYKEVVIADVSFNTQKLLINGPSVQGPDSIYAEVSDFPSTVLDTEPIDLLAFPASYYEDINNDGIKDLIACPNNPNQAEDDESVWLYLNYGEDDLPDFEMIQHNFLQDQMIEVGRGAYPVFVDYNADGLQDLFLSNEKYYEEGPQPPSRISLYENTGTMTDPEYTLIDDNYLNLDELSLLSMYPSFLDLDGDEDLDLLIGDQGGKLHFFRNDAGPDEVFDFTLDTPNYADVNNDPIDVGQFATPQPFDLDNDGKLDLLIGEKNGNINYYRNVGADVAQFELTEDTIGDVIASNYLGINGFSVPYFFRNEEGETRLLLGTEKGIVNYYGNIDDNLEGSFEMIEESFSEIREGDRSAVSFFDLDNDGYRDLIYGQTGGGLAFYKGKEVIINVSELSPETVYNIYPNPTSSILNIEGAGLNGTVGIRVLDIQGRQVQMENLRGPRMSLDMTELSNGIYIIELSDNSGIQSFKVIKK